MKTQSVGMLLVGATLVIAGVLIEGAERSPWNLTVCYFLSVGVIEVVRLKGTLWRWAVCSVVVGLSVYGTAETLGPEHAASPWAALVYVGLVGAVLSSVMMPLRSESHRVHSGA